MNARDEALKAEIQDGIVSFSVAVSQTPAALSERSLSELKSTFRQAVSQAAVHTIILTGPDQAFLTGADVRYFARCVLSGDIDRLLQFTREGRQLFDEIAGCNKQVIAWVSGPAIGAGLELALACHKIVAGPGAKFALPETGLGIYPGLGGTQRTARRIGIGLAKWMIFTGSIVNSEHALEIGLIDAVAPASCTIKQAIESLSAVQPAWSKSDRFVALDQFFTQHNVASLCDPAFPLPADPQLARAVFQIRSKGAVALRLAESIIDRGYLLPLAAGLELEYSHLREVFSTEDARTGLLAMGAKRVEFVGR